jgi:hypothetical protein
LIVFAIVGMIFSAKDFGLFKNLEQLTQAT